MMHHNIFIRIVVEVRARACELDIGHIIKFCNKKKTTFAYTHDVPTLLFSYAS